MRLTLLLSVAAMLAVPMLTIAPGLRVIVFIRSVLVLPVTRVTDEAPALSTVPPTTSVWLPPVRSSWPPARIRFEASSSLLLSCVA